MYHVDGQQVVNIEVLPDQTHVLQMGKGRRGMTVKCISKTDKKARQKHKKPPNGIFAVSFRPQEVLPNSEALSLGQVNINDSLVAKKLLFSWALRVSPRCRSKNWAPPKKFSKEKQFPKTNPFLGFCFAAEDLYPLLLRQGASFLW